MARRVHQIQYDPTVLYQTVDVPHPCEIVSVVGGCIIALIDREQANDPDPTLLKHRLLAYSGHSAPIPDTFTYIGTDATSRLSSGSQLIPVLVFIEEEGTHIAGPAPSKQVPHSRELPNR